MKTGWTLLLFLILFGCAVQPRVHEEPPLELARRNYLKALQHPSNPPMVESAIFHVVKLKLFFPGEDCREITRELERLIHDGQTASIRYKAYLAKMFINNPEWLLEIRKQDYKDGNRFFAMLNEELRHKLLVSQ